MILFSFALFAQTKVLKDNNQKEQKEEEIQRVNVPEEKPEKPVQPIKIEKKVIGNTNQLQNNNPSSNVQQINSKKIKKPSNVSKLYANDKKQTIQRIPQTDSNKTLIKYKKHHHKPYVTVNYTQNVHYHNPINYFYHIPPNFIYRGIWIRYYFVHDDGFFFYDGYPYFVYHNYLHRYSIFDPGFYDLVDSETDEIYATFYGKSSKQSYDRAAAVRDLLNNEEGYYRYFCAERFEYDPDYNYGWSVEDQSDWYWE